MKPAFAVLAAALVVASAVSPAVAAKYTNWGVSQSFDQKGQVTCSLRFAAVQGGETLQLDARKPPKSSNLGASFNLGGLPPYLAGKTGTIRGVKIAFGGWGASGLDANWRKGAADNNSSLNFFASKSIAPVLQPLAGADRVTIAFMLSDKQPHVFNFDLSNTRAPMNSFIRCLNDAKA
jgi:hypothetical protein